MIDTDGILDRCKECGDRERRIQWQGKDGAECTECPNAIDLCATHTGAMVRWNREQRDAKTTPPAGNPALQGG